MARIPIHMPKFGLTMEEGTIMEWKAEIGAPVRAGDVLLCVETEKVVTDIEAPGDGTLVERLFEEKADVKVGEIIAYFDEA
jgi:pyruvate/2-oxoglutarate dehydrogenase complex dihydrolipoamide acyltransferase (E2) component